MVLWFHVCREYDTFSCCIINVTAPLYSCDFSLFSGSFSTRDTQWGHLTAEDTPAPVCPGHFEFQCAQIPMCYPRISAIMIAWYPCLCCSPSWELNCLPMHARQALYHWAVVPGLAFTFYFERVPTNWPRVTLNSLCSPGRTCALHPPECTWITGVCHETCEMSSFLFPEIGHRTSCLCVFKMIIAQKEGSRGDMWCRIIRWENQEARGS